MNDEGPPSAPPSLLQMKRFKLVWRILLLSNFALGAYLFANAKPRESTGTHGRAAQKLQKGKVNAEVPPEPDTSSMDLNYDDFFAPVTMPAEVRPSITDEQHREIFQWMLEEKRRLKPKDRIEKKQIDEEKAILKQFLRAKSIPKF